MTEDEEVGYYLSLALICIILHLQYVVFTYRTLETLELFRNAWIGVKRVPVNSLLIASFVPVHLTGSNFTHYRYIQYLTRK